MQVKKAIILAAGKGTRMGPLGEVLTKPVWPFFDSTLIELQIKFLRNKYGIEKFYINSHHLSEQLNFIKSEDVHVINEPILLDQGGGILNILKRYDLWDEPILVNNSDQLYFFEEINFRKAENIIENSGVVLFGLNVNKSEKYNKLLIAEQKLTGIKQNDQVECDEFVTYSGMALINCSRVTYDNEILKFFDSIADFKSKKVSVLEIERGRYFDFGKLNSYYDLCFSTRDNLANGVRTDVTDLLSKNIQDFVTDSEGLNFSGQKTETALKGEILFNCGKIFSRGSKVESEVYR